RASAPPGLAARGVRESAQARARDAEGALQPEGGAKLLGVPPGDRDGEVRHAAELEQVGPVEEAFDADDVAQVHNVAAVHAEEPASPDPGFEVGEVQARRVAAFGGAD